jgi:hypothetical protein
MMMPLLNGGYSAQQNPNSPLVLSLVPLDILSKITEECQRHAVGARKPSTRLSEGIDNFTNGNKQP